MSGRTHQIVRLLTPIFLLVGGANLYPVFDAQGEPAAGGIAEGAGSAYEIPGTLRADELLPAYLLSGELFTVDPEVRNDGETNHYLVRSRLGGGSVAGRDELEETIQEIRALDLLQESSKRSGAMVGFNQGVKSLAVSPYRNVKRVAFNPLYAIEAVPSEVADYAGKIATVSDLVKYGPRVFIRRSLGIDGARNDLARRLRVDNDTDNEALRKEINRVGWGVWAGGVVPEIGDGYADLTIDLSTEVGDLGDGNLGRAVDAIRREAFPRSARRLLKKMDVSKDVSKSFRENAHYKGRMRESMASALLAMPDTEGRSEYIAWADGVKNAGEARHAVRLAQVMAVSNASEEPITRIRRRGEVLAFETKKGDVVVPVLFDHLIWSEPASRHMDVAAELKEEIAPGNAMAIWSTGEVSPRVREVLVARGWAVRTNVDQAYSAFERPRKGLGALEQRYERRVEEPVKDEVQERLPERDRRLDLAPLGPINP